MSEWSKESLWWHGGSQKGSATLDWGANCSQTITLQQLQHNGTDCSFGQCCSPKISLRRIRVGMWQDSYLWGVWRAVKTSLRRLTSLEEKRCAQQEPNTTRHFGHYLREVSGNRNLCNIFTWRWNHCHRGRVVFIFRWWTRHLSKGWWALAVRSTWERRSCLFPTLACFWCSVDSHQSENAPTSSVLSQPRHSCTKCVGVWAIRPGQPGQVWGSESAVFILLEN